MNASLRQLEAFRAVAKLGSFTRAAAHVGVSQPILSNQIRDLEAVLGVRLFDRTTRRVMLTQAGEQFFDSTVRILGDLDSAVRAMQAVAARQSGLIAVAAPPLLASVMLPIAIAAFRRDYPGISVELIDVRTDQMLQRLRAGEADMAVGTFAAGESDISRTLLVRDQLMVFCGDGSPLAARDEVEWAALAGEPLATLKPGSGIRALVEDGHRSAGIAFTPAFEVEQVTTALALTEAGLCATVLPAYAWAGLRGRGVCARYLITPQITREIVASTLHGRAPSPAMEAFLPFVRQAALSSMPSTPVSR
ncbi:LysR family transcriptional regulator [Phreatobacter stygius]|uniref:LysR family transcriptional regulator n=1 Tax=Phreatobacter stygius TaxID=1940610 RepID=A0A4D7B841_9HYPH|nr:LysR family transcriptional regulator [Phreatobacter stygius]QCI66590.1 LysR family transcriptional regulator [Phreatobacter stygius]